MLFEIVCKKYIDSGRNHVGNLGHFLALYNCSESESHLKICHRRVHILNDDDKLL